MPDNPPPDTQPATPNTPLPNVQRPTPNALLWLDILLCVVLFFAALPIRFGQTRGDLWFDEADYAMAAQAGFSHNRWDTSPDPRTPDALVKLRHYHAPLTVILAGLGATVKGDLSERTLRTPFVVAGALTVAVVYLCGIPLFGGRREIGFACALIVLVTPMHLRASSHAIPWALITLFLMMLFWTMAAFSVNRKPGWLTLGIVTLGLIFITTEMFFPVLLAVALVSPFLLKKGSWSKELSRAAGLGAIGFLVLGIVFWPSGLLGGAFKMLFHYTNIRDIVYPVNIGDRVFAKAPIWAYFYWYSHDFLPYFALYVSGALAFVWLLVTKRATSAMRILAVYTLLFLAVAHKAHIIGPEYLVHCLPLLTLLGGLLFYAMSLIWRPAGILAFFPICVYLFHWVTVPVRGEIEAKSRVPRWPPALTVLKPLWKPGDKILIGPQTPNVALWYLKWAAGLPVREGQIGPLPPKVLTPKTRERINGGYYRFLVVSSAFSATPTLSPEIVTILKTWHVLHRSAEPDGLPQLTIYEYPGVQHVW